jgi:hypothetical protein
MAALLVVHISFNKQKKIPLRVGSSSASINRATVMTFRYGARQRSLWRLIFDRN